MTAERQSMEADIVCVGFGPATAGFLTTLSRAMMNPDGTPAFESKVMPGMPLQVMSSPKPVTSAPRSPISIW